MRHSMHGDVRDDSHFIQRIAMPRYWNTSLFNQVPIGTSSGMSNIFLVCQKLRYTQGASNYYTRGCHLFEYVTIKLCRTLTLVGKGTSRVSGRQRRTNTWHAFVDAGEFQLVYRGLAQVRHRSCKINTTWLIHDIIGLVTKLASNIGVIEWKLRLLNKHVNRNILLAC